MWRIGHRGACGHAPENTLASMRKALEIGVDGFEFDIQLSKDGIPVVIHDDTLERTTNGKGKVSDFSLKDLQKLDAGNSNFLGEKIPTLQDVIDMADKRTRLFIELKADGATEPVADMVSNAVKKLGWSYEQFFICSFNHQQIALSRLLLPEVSTCAVLVGIPVTLAEIAVQAGAWALSSAVHHTNQALVDDARARGLKVMVWTADKPEEIAKARALKVDGIISNYPDRL
ncbi:MAG: glycerophosphodiester phosphodiesterase family protein [Pseudomonadota bacterium]